MFTCCNDVKSGPIPAFIYCITDEKSVYIGSTTKVVELQVCTSPFAQHVRDVYANPTRLKVYMLVASDWVSSKTSDADMQLQLAFIPLLCIYGVEAPDNNGLIEVTSKLEYAIRDAVRADRSLYLQTKPIVTTTPPPYASPLSTFEI